MHYKYSKSTGALNEVAQVNAPMRQRVAEPADYLVQAQSAGPSLMNALPGAPTLSAQSRFGGGEATRASGVRDPERPSRPYAPEKTRMRWTYWSVVVEEGQRALVVERDGKMWIAEGPQRVARRRGRDIRAMEHHAAHPGEFLLVRFRDGRQEHLVGPADVWADPRIHQSIEREDALQLAAKEAVVVYAKQPDGRVGRRVVHGPAAFVPAPGEWLHTFSWHGPAAGGEGYVKVPNALVFQKLWLMPDQMYHDIDAVRTADDAVLTVRLMIFFELVDVERMLDGTHDPIGDFVNAATSDVIDFAVRYPFAELKRHTEQLSEIATYRQLHERAAQCGYRIGKVVYRGYGASDSLQQMHDQAIEARTRLELEKATEAQAQDLEDDKLERTMARAAKERAEGERAQAASLTLERDRVAAEIERARERARAGREDAGEAARAQREIDAAKDRQVQAHLAALAGLGVDLTRYLTQARADRLIEVRGASASHLHLHGEEAAGASGIA